MAKVQIKSEKITPFGEIFHERELFPRFAGPFIDKIQGLRCTSYGYLYSEIVQGDGEVRFSWNEQPELYFLIITLPLA